MAAPLGSTPGIIVGVGVGAAASAALEPAIELPRQKVWQDNPNRILDPATVARLVAQGGVTLGEAQAEAKRDGYGADRLNALVYLAQTVPPVAEALRLWRRGLITDALWSHVLVKSGIDSRYVPGLNALKTSERLDPAVVATLIQRTVADNPGILPNQPGTAGSNVPPMPQVALDPVEEAAASGLDKERLSALTRIVGLPASPDLAARMHFRDIITEGAFNQAILEGNTRGEWAPFLLEGFRQILTAHDYAELELRGFLTKPERLDGTDKHGMSHADSDLLYDVLGRAIPEHQVVTGEARGGTFRGDFSHIPEAFLSSLRRSNIRPEYYSLAYANRYTYPSAFVLRSLTQNGDITQAESHQILLDIGWRPDLAEKVSARWAGGTGAAADPHVSKAENQLWTTLHKTYVLGDTDDAQARNLMGDLLIPGFAQEQILALWRSERTLRRKELTDAALRKAVKGQQLTRQEALDELVARGYTTEDANIFLDQSPKPA